MDAEPITKEEAEQYFPILDKTINENRDLVISKGFDLMINLLKEEHNLTGRQAFKVYVYYARYLDTKRTIESKVFDN